MPLKRKLSVQHRKEEKGKKSRKLEGENQSPAEEGKGRPCASAGEKKK